MYKKDIIIVYHIPVDGLTRQQAEEQIYESGKILFTGDFYKEYFLPYTGGDEKIIKIEIINLKGQKTEKIELKIDELNETIMKYFDYKKWLRLKKLRNVLK